MKKTSPRTALRFVFEYTLGVSKSSQWYRASQEPLLHFREAETLAKIYHWKTGGYRGRVVAVDANGETVKNFPAVRVSDEERARFKTAMDAGLIH